MQGQSLQNYNAAVPVIATADVCSTIRYFEQTLGPWGVRQYVVREPNGYHLKVAESYEADDHG